MHAAKVIPIAAVILLVLATGVFYFVPSTRPAIVDGWFKSAQGYKPAKSAEDALDQFRKAIEARKYDIAKDYLSGDYLEFFIKGSNDARELVRAIDELRDVMKSTGVKSDKVDGMLFWLEPFPTFKYDVKNKATGAVTGVIHWREDGARLRDAIPKTFAERWDIDPMMVHGLLPTPPQAIIPPDLMVIVKETNGVWKIEMPVQAGRHMRDTIEALRKNATNFRNALQDVKQNIKNNPAVKEDFEREFKATIEKAK